MPLRLNTPDSERPKRIVWDPLNVEDQAQAHDTIKGLLNQGFRVMEDFENAEVQGTLARVLNTGLNHGEVLLYPPTKLPNTSIMRILDETGDKRVVWDRTMADQVKDAYQKFKDLITQGYRAYVARSDGSKGSKLEDFDPLLEEIILVPATVPG